MSRAVYIVSTGARTPLGLDGAASAAAVRGALSAAREHPFLVDQIGDPMPGALDAGLDPRMLAPERMEALARSALLEACAPFAEAGIRSAPLPLFVGMPEYRPGFDPHDSERLRVSIAATPDLPVTISAVTAAPVGHAAGVAAIAKGMQQIEAGVCEACLVGGIDSYFHPETMEWLDANLQLAGAVSRSGFVPGEGAAFSLLMSADACSRYGFPALARVRSAGTARESNLIKTTDQCIGRGLTDAVRAAVRALDEEARSVNAVICDVNGERYRGEEWAFVSLRLAHCFDDPTAYEAPADCWGDMGAASGPLFAMLACRAAERGYAAGPNTLIWASSEQGLRAAALLESARAA